MKLGIIAGEASGNLLGAGLLRALRHQQTSVKVSGIGGPDMIAYGCHSLYDMERLAVMGIIEPLRRLPELIRMRHHLYQHFISEKPDVFVGIDSPDFNLGLEIKLRRAGIPIVHYVSPSVWAWRKKRIVKIAKAVDLMLTLFPFETAFYEQHGVPARFVGHPLADAIPLESNMLSARQTLGLEEAGDYIAVLPGSRKNELKYLAETFVQTALRCWQERPSLKFISSAVNPLRDQEFQTICRRIAPELPITFFVGKTHDVMAAANVVLVTSGTATLETMLLKRPMIVAYKMAGMTYQIAKRMVNIPYIGLPNLLANEKLVPEFIQDAAEPSQMMEAIFDYLDHPEAVVALRSKFDQIHRSLRCDANQRAAESVINLLNR